MYKMYLANFKITNFPSKEEIRRRRRENLEGKGEFGERSGTGEARVAATRERYRAVRGEFSR